MNQATPLTNTTNFTNTFARILQQQVTRHPGHYPFKTTEVQAVVPAVTREIVEGNPVAKHFAFSLRMTAKELGIHRTTRAIRKYLQG